MKTSLIIPFKNEVEYADRTMRKTHAYLSEHEIEFEIIVVDDSNDGTWEVLSAFSKAHKNVLLLKGDHPPGYGKALKKGLGTATGDILIPFNGDLSDSLDDVISYVQLIKNGNDMVFGSRFMSGSSITNATAIKGFISRLGNFFLQKLFHVGCSDITNSFKAYRRTVLDEIKPTANGYHIGMEMALKGVVKGYKYTTTPIAWSGREYGCSKMTIMKSIPAYLSTAFRIKFSK